MQCSSSTQGILAAVMLMALVAAARAQPEAEEPRRYVEFKIDPDFQKLLKERLQTEKELGPLKDLVKQIAADPRKFPVDPAQLKDFKLDDPKFKKALQDWAASDPELRKALGDWLKENPPKQQPANVKQFQKELKEILDKTPKNIAAPKPAERMEPIKPKTDSLGKVAERVMKRAENTKLGDWLRDSPAWNRAFDDLRGSMHQPDAPHWGLPDGKTLQLGAETFKQLRHLPRPDFENFNWKGSLPAIGSMPTPNLAPPGLPDVGGPSLPSIGTGMTWLLLLLLLLCALFAWQLLRWTKRSASADDQRSALGPWPVRPETVSTRTELVLAFDYLALLTLGIAVQSWNHHAIARRWCEQTPDCAESAGRLAQLYEQARYTIGVEALTESQREQARRSLLQLAEAL